MTRALPLSLCLLALGSSAAPAAPSQLHDKAIFTSVNIAVTARAEDGSSTARPRQIDRIIYISTKGRLFSRVSRQAGRHHRTRELGPETTSGAFRFQGNTLIGVLNLLSGAAQLTITFDPSFSSCTATVVMGREAGKVMKIKGLNGKTYTVEGKPSISSVSCSVRSGNPFG
jgi:hypothetical protein